MADAGGTGGRPVGEDSIWPAREDGRQPSSLPAQRGVADGVDAPVERDKQPGRDAAVDGARSKAGGGQVAPRHDAELTRRELDDGPGRSGRTAHVVETVGPGRAKQDGFVAQA
ncbi:MAG: hypothetical protein R2736_21930 [Solirubrobacterales bacterium]